LAKPLALTLGEPAGIGPDIAIAAWLRRTELGLPPFYLLGDGDFIGMRAKALGVEVKLAEVRAEQALDIFADALPIVATGIAAQGGTARVLQFDVRDRAACREHALANFSAKRMADNYEELYKKLVSL